jgi:hypothetical protein
MPSPSAGVRPGLPVAPQAAEGDKGGSATLVEGGRGVGGVLEPVRRRCHSAASTAAATMATTPTVAPTAAGTVLAPPDPLLPVGESVVGDTTPSVPPPSVGAMQGPTAPGAGLRFPLRYRPEPQEVQPFTELNAQVRHATSHTPAVVDRVVRDTTGWVVNCTPARVTKGSLVARVEACCCGQRRGRGGETETEVEKVGKGGRKSPPCMDGWSPGAKQRLSFLSAEGMAACRPQSRLQ